MISLGTIAVGSALAAAAMFVWAGPAAAHVTVTAPGATQGGGDQEITFRVPVEKDANTIGLRIALPSDTPIASVDVQAMPGWTHTQKSVKLATPLHTQDGEITEVVSEIDWTVQPGQGLKPGEFGAFTIIAGQLPDTPTLTFKAIQIYSDGTSVSWIQTAAPGSTTEPDFPAPALHLARPAPTPSTGPAVSAKTVTSKAGNTAPVLLSILALVLAVIAVGLGVVARARARRV